MGYGIGKKHSAGSILNITIQQSVFLNRPFRIIN